LWTKIHVLELISMKIVMHRNDYDMYVYFNLIIVWKCLNALYQDSLEDEILSTTK